METVGILKVWPVGDARRTFFRAKAEHYPVLGNCRTVLFSNCSWSLIEGSIFSPASDKKEIHVVPD